MFIKLKNQTHIDSTKVSSISPNGQNHLLKMTNGALVDVTAEEFPWLVKICGFMIETKDKNIINLKSIATTVINDNGALVSLDNGDTFQVSAEENFALAGECQCMDLEQRILFLQSKNINPNDYKKI